MLLTLEFLGIDKEKIRSTITPQLNKMNNYLVFENCDIEVVFAQIGSLIQVFAAIDAVCIGIIIRVDYTVYILRVSSENEEVEVSEPCEIGDIETICELYKPEQVAIIQEMGEQEYRVVTEEVYEWKKTIKI